MSWWNTNFSDLASQALKNAQKQIDKVLDIDEKENTGASSESDKKSQSKEEKPKPEKDKSNFWSTWSGTVQIETVREEESRSAWSMPWGSTYKDSTSDTGASEKHESTVSLQRDNKSPITTDTKKNEGINQSKDESNKKDRLKRENSGSSHKSKKSSSSKSDKDKSSEGKKVEPVSNVPHIKSQEKVDNWDISSGWQSETLTGWQDEVISDNTEKHVPDSKTSSDRKHQQSTKVLERLKQEDELKLEQIILPKVNTESENNSPEKLSALSKSYVDTGQGLLMKTDHMSKSLSNDYKVESTFKLESESQQADLTICESTEQPEKSVEGSVSKSSSFQNEEQSSSISVIDSSQSGDVYSPSSDNNTHEVISVSDVTDTENSPEGNMYMTLKNENQQICVAVETVEPVEEVTVVNDNISQKSNEIESEKDDTSSSLEVLQSLSGETSVKVNDVNTTPDKESSDMLTTDEIAMGMSAGSNTSGDSAEENLSSQGSGEAEKETQGDFNEGSGQGPPLSPSACSSVCSSDTSKLDSSMDTHTSEDTVVDKVAIEDGEEKDEEDDSKTQKGEESVEGDFHGLKNNDSMFSVSSSSSYVKCMIEEAMEDNGRVEDSNSDHDCHSTGGEKSECSRSTGGHESGDEIDTTTSSDIEIISTPNSNGDGSKIVDLSPLKIALQKTARRGSPTHRRTDSQSSSSTQSREGQGEQLSPGRESIEDEGQYMEERKSSQEEHRLAPVSEERSDPNSQQKLLKLQTVPEHSEVQLTTHSNNTDTSDSLPTQKMNEMAEVIKAREDRLLQLSKENNDLMEANNILRSQLQQSEEVREAEMADINKLTTEFTQRIGDSDKKVNTVIRERDAMKKQLEQMQEDCAKKMRSIEQVLEEKDQQISELLQEGEKLSKHQLQSNNIVKKLRSKEKENDTLITSQKKKLDDQKVELEHLRKVCESKDDMEKKQTDAINQLNTAVQKQEREVAKLKGELEDAQERVRGLQTALDNSYKEITELNKSNAAQDSKAQETALSVEMHLREELKMTLEKEQHMFKQEKEALIMQIEDLRMSMSRLEKEHSRREDMLRQEISDLQMHLQEDEARNQDLTQSVTSATRPLLRQIENLQSTYGAQSTAWERVEKNLTDRLTDSQNQLAMVIERERSASEKVIDLNSQVTSYESQNSRLRQEKSQLSAQLEMLKSKVEVLEDAKNNEVAQLEVMKQQMSHDLHELRKEKVFLETQLDMEKTKVEQERKKYNLAQDQISVLEREAHRPLSRGSVSPQTMSRQGSVSAMSEPSAMSASFTQDDMEKNFLLSPEGHTFAGLSNKTNLYEALRQSGAVNILENLQSQLKLREGEILQLQSDIQQLERTRESMARELVNLTNKNEELQEKVEDLPDINRKLEDVNQRYNALLQMYGEKVEEADELKLDLHDVKEMYKMQIDHLLAK